MSYDIYIGEAVLVAPDPEEHNRMSVKVRGVSQPDAPTFPEDGMTGNGNSRHPGYSQWTDFTRTASIYDLFFDKEEGLMREHPGCFLLRQRDLDRVRFALDQWRSKHQGTVPGFGDREYFEKEIARLKPWVESGALDAEPERKACVAARLADYQRDMAALPPSGTFDPVLARLIWLEWWMAWALANCKTPAIHNH